MEMDCNFYAYIYVYCRDFASRKELFIVDKSIHYIEFTKPHRKYNKPQKIH